MIECMSPSCSSQSAELPGLTYVDPQMAPCGRGWLASISSHLAIILGTVTCN